MLWSRHVKPSSAKGEKRLKRKKIPKFVQTEPFRSQHHVQLWGSLYRHERPNHAMQRNTALRKNLPETLTAVFSPSRTASRAPQGSSIWFDHCRHWGGVAIVALVCSLFFFLERTTGTTTNDVVGRATMEKSGQSPWCTHQSIKKGKAKKIRQCTSILFFCFRRSVTKVSTSLQSNQKFGPQQMADALLAWELRTSAACHPQWSFPIRSVVKLQTALVKVWHIKLDSQSCRWLCEIRGFGAGLGKLPTQQFKEQSHRVDNRSCLLVST